MGSDAVSVWMERGYDTWVSFVFCVVAVEHCGLQDAKNSAFNQSVSFAAGCNSYGIAYRTVAYICFGILLH